MEIQERGKKGKQLIIQQAKPFEHTRLLSINDALHIPQEGGDYFNSHSRVSQEKHSAQFDPGCHLQAGSWKEKLTASYSGRR